MKKEKITLLPQTAEFKRTTKLARKFNSFTVELARYNCTFYCNNFSSRTSDLWNSLPLFRFRVTCNLHKIKSIAIIYLPEICSFIVFSPP